MTRPTVPAIRTAALALLSLALSGTAAQAFSYTDVQLHYGDGFRLGRNGTEETSRAVLTLEHFSTFGYGDFFAFIDLFNDFDGPDTNTESGHYGEAYVHFSSKAFGLDLGDGFLRDIGPGIGINHGDDFGVGLIGARAGFNVPGFNLLSLGLYSYNNYLDPFDRDLDSTYQVTIAWNAPFEIGSQKFTAQGFVDFIGDQGSGVDDQIVFSPQLRWDVGNALGHAPGTFDLGLEYTHFRNKFGVTGVDDNSLTLFAAMRF